MKDGACSDMAAEAVKGLLEKTNTNPEEMSRLLLSGQLHLIIHFQALQMFYATKLVCLTHGVLI